MKFKFFSYLVLFLFFLRQFYLINILWVFFTKKIYFNSYNKKNIFIMPKSGGLNDLINDFNKDEYQKNKVNVFSLNRYFFSSIWHHLNIKYSSKDIKNKSKHNKKALLYRSSLRKIMKYYLKYYKIDLFITFNFYDLEFEFLEILNDFQVKTLIYFKESLKSKNNWNEITKVYGRNFYSFKNSKFFFMAVYTENAKNAFLEAELVNINNINTVGCGRLDYSFALKNKFKPINKRFKILYYLIQNTACLPVFNGYLFLDGKKKYLDDLNWLNLSKRVNSFILEFAKKYQEVDIVLKSKIGFDDEQLNDFKNKLPVNLKIIKGGIGHDLLREADLVIGFNTTAIFEAIAACKPTINLNFTDSYKRDLDRFLLNDSNIFNEAKNEIDLENKILQIIKKKSNKVEITDKQRVLLKHFFGNDNGNASKDIVDYIAKILT